MKPPPTLTDPEFALWLSEASAGPQHARCRMTNGTLLRLLRRAAVAEGREVLEQEPMEIAQ